METSLDCIPCFIRQSLEAARFLTREVRLHEQIVRIMLHEVAEMDLKQSPPVVAQKIHRILKDLIGSDDPYYAAKDRFNHLAIKMLPDLSSRVRNAEDPLLMAVRLAIAGNVIDLGVNGTLTENQVCAAMEKALEHSFSGEIQEFKQALNAVENVLYLTDNAGEIIFDKLLIEQLKPLQVTVAVRGAAVLNDATMQDAQEAGLQEIAEVINNGSDAPGTLLNDCSAAFRKRFAEADLIIAKGQGNFESLSGETADIFFLLEVKCPVVAAHTGKAVGTHLLLRSGNLALV